MGIRRVQSVQAPWSEQAGLHRTQIRRPNSSPLVTPPPAIGSGTAGPQAAQVMTDSRIRPQDMRIWRTHTSASGQALQNHLEEKHLRSPRGNKRMPA